MAKLKDVQYAVNGEAQNTEAKNSEQQMVDIAMEENPLPKQEFVIFKLVDTNKRGGVYIPTEDDVVNPTTKKVERIRLLSGVDSIWMKDQKDLPDDYVKVNRREMKFPRGTKILRVPIWDTQFLEFARICRHNIGSPNRKSGSRFEFFEYDPLAQQKAALEKEMLEMEMVLVATKEPIEKVRKHANYLGIVAVDEFGIPKTDEGIRREYMLAAKRNPQRFKQSLGSKEVEVSYLVKRAILDAKIDLGGAHGGMVSWANGGQICRIPANRKANEYLLELAMTNSEEGKKFLHQLESFVS